jgi:hypothetical protein
VEIMANRKITRPGWKRMKHAKRVMRRGTVYWYHQITGERLPDDPHSDEFRIRLAEINREIGEDGHKDALKASPMAIKQAKRAKTFVYFIQTRTGPIKIGMSSKPKKRMANLLSSHHEDVELMGFVQAGRWFERELHNELAEHRLRGEWYRPCLPVMRRIDELITAGEAF